MTTLIPVESTGADSTFPDTASPIIDAQRPEMMPLASIVEILRHTRYTSWRLPCLRGTLQEPVAPAESFAVLPLLPGVRDTSSHEKSTVSGTIALHFGPGLDARIDDGEDVDEPE